MKLKLAGILPLFAMLAPLLCCSGRAQAGESYALLVSVAEYDKTELRPLRFTRNDVFEFQTALRSAGWKPENIVLLHDDPKRLTDVRYLSLAENIRTELKLLLSGLRSDDKLIIAFAGHGIQFSGEKESYFCPRDAKLTKRDTLVSFGDILKQLDDCQASQKLLLVDACRNDPQSEVARSRSVVSLESITRPQQMNVPRSLLAMFSCAAGQQSFEDPDLKHGIFFNYVLKGWNGAADTDRNSEISFRELEGYVSRETTQHARLSFKAAQTPQLKGELSGDWVLRKLPVRGQFQPLFNGTDLSGWYVAQGGREAWRVDADSKTLTALDSSANRGWLLTDKSYKDYTLKFEFQLSSRAQSGVAIHAFPGDSKFAEIQILDDDRYPTAKQILRTGSLYGIAQNNAAQLKPIGEWNTMEIEVRGRSLWVSVNERMVTTTAFALVKAPGTTPIPSLQRSAGHIGLQSASEGTTRFRNIEIREHEFVPMFNGNDLTGWNVDSGDPETWSASGGILTAAVNNRSKGWLFSEKDYGDFAVRLEYQSNTGSNSGIAFRTAPGEGANTRNAIKLLEVNFQDDTYPIFAKQVPLTTKTGALFNLAVSRSAQKAPLGSWNDAELIVRGREVHAMINGVETLSTNLDQFAESFNKIPGLQRRSGRIGLQNWFGTTRFRNIRINAAN